MYMYNSHALYISRIAGINMYIHACKCIYFCDRTVLVNVYIALVDIEKQLRYMLARPRDIYTPTICL